MWRIDKFADGKATILRISGRIQSACFESWRRKLRHSPQTILDLEHVTLVDRLPCNLSAFVNRTASNS